MICIAKNRLLGENAAPVLFPEGSPVGKDVIIDSSAFLVIGVVEKAQGMFGNDDEDRRVRSYNTFRKIYPGSYENQIRFQAYGTAVKAVDQTTEVLRRRRNVPTTARTIFDQHLAAGS
jgi:hypothetical protein